MRSRIGSLLLLVTAFATAADAAAQQRPAATVARPAAARATHAPRLPDRVSIVLLGDLPYDTLAERRWDEVRASVAGANGDVVIHVGDYKAGAAPCTAALAQKRRRQIMALGPRVVFLPGDNEWTDCPLPKKQGKRSDRERDDFAIAELARLRRTFWAGGTRSFGAEGMEVERQGAPFAEFVENQRWRIGKVAFVGVNVPGVSDPKRARRLAHVLPAATRWVADGVRWAKAADAHVLVVAMQANPVQPSFLAENVALRAMLRETARSFPGRVVLLHGDTHCFAVQEPLWADRPNLMRVETDGAPRVGWTAVTITTGATAQAARVAVADHPLFRDSGRQPCPERARGRQPPLPAED